MWEPLILGIGLDHGESHVFKDAREARVYLLSSYCLAWVGNSLPRFSFSPFEKGENCCWHLLPHKCIQHRCIPCASLATVDSTYVPSAPLLSPFSFHNWIIISCSCLTLWLLCALSHMRSSVLNFLPLSCTSFHPQKPLESCQLPKTFADSAKWTSLPFF